MPLRGAALASAVVRMSVIFVTMIVIAECVVTMVAVHVVVVIVTAMTGFVFHFCAMSDVTTTIFLSVFIIVYFSVLVLMLAAMIIIITAMPAGTLSFHFFVFHIHLISILYIYLPFLSDCRRSFRSRRFPFLFLRNVLYG